MASPIALGKHYADTQALKLDVATMFRQQGRGFCAGKGGGGRQKKYLCNAFKEGCKAEVRVVKQSSGEFKVTHLVSEHNECSGGPARASSAALAGLANAALGSNPTMKTTDLKRSLEQESGLKTSYSAANRMKLKATRASEAQLKHSYSVLASYCRQLVKDSPGSVAVVQRESDGTFKSVSFMLGRSTFAALRSPFKIVSMDGGHLKGEWNGVMLTLSCKDANNTVIHVATIIGPKENADLYQALLRTCKKNQQLKEFLEDSMTTYFTDGHKGSPAALKREGGDAQQRLCLKHITGNLTEKIGSEANGWLFHAARAPSTAQCDAILEQHVLPTKPKVYEEMVQRPRSQWAHSGGPADTVIADQVTSNVAESTMSQVGGEARKLPPPELMKRILERDAERYAKRATLGKDGDKWTPFAAKTFEDQREKSKGLLPVATGNGFYNVANSTLATQATRVNRVLLKFGGPGEDNQWTCTCCFPARFRIPCCDIIAVAREEDKMEEVMNLMHPAYRMEHYRETYNDERFRILLPVPSMLEADPTLLPPARVDGQAGAPRKRGPKRFKRIEGRGSKNASSAFNSPLPPNPGPNPPPATTTSLSQGGASLSQGGASLLQGGASSAPLNVD